MWILLLIFSRGSEDLMPPDLILISVQCIAAQEYWKDIDNIENNKDGANRLPCKYF